MRYTSRSNFLLMLLALFFTLSTLSIPKTVNNRRELEAHDLGYPVSFLQQDLSILSIGEVDSIPFPQSIGLMGIWDHPTTFKLLPFLLSVIIVWALLTGIREGVRLLSRRRTP